ncbi:hypothetical protein LCGC14_0753660 [marine sediment metagenome]|uniref:MaoC-like domain-containing protein n=1 Tax=marine sediment metagenome TaxID=412755 RepID=A0A0F9QN37_9ZZZZ
MSIDLSAIGQTRESIFEYNWKDVVLYALGIGAQTSELPFLYERTQGGVKVFPSYATIAGDDADLLDKLGDLNRAKLIHGEQHIKLYRPFPSQGKITRKCTITNVYDKGKNAIIHSISQGFNEDGEHIFDAKWVHVLLDAGRFGGESGPKAQFLNPPEGKRPDFSVSYKTTENQAAIYRLSGNLNPLHLDPSYAKSSGRFNDPILHGLCTYGFAARAILFGACDGDVNRFKEFSGRFSQPVIPGDTIITEGWKDNGRYIIQAHTEKNVVLSNAYAIVE